MSEQTPKQPDRSPKSAQDHTEEMTQLEYLLSSGVQCMPVAATGALVVALIGGMLTNRWLIFAFAALVGSLCGSLVIPLWYLTTRVWLSKGRNRME